MVRPISAHRCRTCGALAQRWVGRCPECGEWNSFEEWSGPSGPARAGAGRGRSGGGAGCGAPVPLADVDLASSRPIPTGIAEVDRVLAGGLLAGSTTLVYGEPGVGKSTLLLQILLGAAALGRTVLLVSAEESAPQVRSRAERLGPLPPGLLVVATPDIAEAEDAATALGPDLLVVDSIQTVGDAAVPGAAGSLSQVRACAERLTRMARQQSIATVLVGHVTKDGGLAGPRALEHVVDTVVAFEGDRHHSLRMLRAIKHRFGTTGEVGLFEMGESGLSDVADPGPMLLGDRRAEVPGSAVCPLLEGRRPLLVELQALACTGGGGGARRTARGVDSGRLAMVVAVLECRAGVALGGSELFVSAAGGVSANEPAADLALALAVASAAAGVPLPSDLVAFGEVGLGGEVRQVPGTGRRVTEAGRLGFARALVPVSTEQVVTRLEMVPVRTVSDALAVAFADRSARSDRSARASGGPVGPVPPGGLPALPASTMPSWSTRAASR